MIPHYNLGLGHLYSPQEAPNCSDGVQIGPGRFDSDNGYEVCFEANVIPIIHFMW